MKKYIICILLFAMLLPTVAMAEKFMFQVEITDSTQIELPPLPSLGYDCYLLETGGEQYFFRTNDEYYTFPFRTIPYKQQEFDFFAPKNECEYIWTGEYYYARRTQYDAWPQRSRLPYSFPIKLYDANFQLVKEYQMPYYPYEIDYVDGVYYCYCDYSHYYKSTDFETWEEVEPPLPRANSGFLKSRKVTAVQLNDNYYPVICEDKDADYASYTCKYGDIILYSVSAFSPTYYFSKDNVNFVQIDVPETKEDDIKSWHMGDIRCIYESGNEIILESITGRLKFPKDVLDAELAKGQAAPYVCVNNSILGFETPPVTESDRTLVPMRFLFEQLGAEVTWDEATETATAKKANTTINFSIDNTTATVNGAETVMDVPARLVNDKTMVPLRFLSEEMGYTVEWDEETRMATITTPLTSRVTKTETNMFDTWIR